MSIGAAIANLRVAAAHFGFATTVMYTGYTIRVTFQETCEQEAVEFPSGSTWIAFTDQVSHAAMAGQYQFEQTFLLPVDAMIDESLSPLRILERLEGRPLTS